MTSSARTRVLIVDDQPLIRSALRALVGEAADIEVVGEAAEGGAAARAVAALQPDVVLMDVRMPGMDGIEATALIRQRHPEVEVVVLTTFDDDRFALDAVRAGACGFLLKDGDADDLLRGIRLAAAGDALMAPSTLRRLLDRVGSTPPEEADAARVASLSARETEVLRCAARGMNNAEIAAELVISEATAKSHIASILAKLGVRDRVQAVVLAHTSGLMGGR
jgi:DNA-binding NarL/FixJ family response regulator